MVRAKRCLTPFFLASSIILIAASSCTPHLTTSTKSAASARADHEGQQKTPSALTTTTPRPAHKAHTFAERRPEMGITTPMKGEPTTKAQIAESHLTASSCEQASTEDADAHVNAMRVAVNDSFMEWVKEQPACWQQMREEWLWQQRMKKLQQGNMWGDAVGDAFGVGGLGLSGVGEGGGGRGEGIGLGSVGTIGHGAGAGGQPRTAKSASGTNNQVVGVDEADIVKNDGRYVYFAANGALRIATALEPQIISVTKLTSAGGTVRELFVEGDRAVVYTSSGAVGNRCTYGYDCTFGGDGTSTKISVLDITNRKEPKVTREMDLSGSLIAARRIGNAVHTVIADGDTPNAGYETWPAGLEMCGTPEKVVKARFAALKADNEKKIRAKTTKYPTLRDSAKGRSEQRLCGGGREGGGGALLRTPIRDGEAFTTILSFDLKDDKAPVASASLESRPGAVFASQNALYVSVVHRKAEQTTAGGGGANGSARWYSYYEPSVNEVSEIHKFRIGASPQETKYAGSGTVPGHVLNQFSMDEWYGYLRIATTKGKVPDPKVESVVSILAEDKKSGGGNLVRIGAVDKIAPGEDIRAVRFEEERGYVVTFKKTDPLFVLDMQKPTKPQILGELKIPGFSTYMHRIDPEHLLSIGFDANDHGDFAYFDGVILQLFDVKNPTDPRLVHKEKIGTRGSSSEAATNHLAFNYFASEGLLAIPMTICDGGGDGRNGDQLAFSGLLVYDVDIERGFTKLGGVDHGTKGVTCSTWWSNANSAVKRSIFLDDLVYSITSEHVKVQRMSHFGADVADLSLM